MNPDNYKFTHEMKVRDYECDLQGIVNNANYQHYMEHSRHELLERLGVNFGKLHEDGIDAMVAKITIEYKIPLRKGIVETICVENGRLTRGEIFDEVFKNYL